MDRATLATVKDESSGETVRSGKVELGLDGPRPDLDPSLSEGGDEGDGVEGHEYIGTGDRQKSFDGLRRRYASCFLIAPSLLHCRLGRLRKRRDAAIHLLGGDVAEGESERALAAAVREELRAREIRHTLVGSLGQ